MKASLAFTYDHNDPKLLDTILPFIRYIETTPDTIAMIPQDEEPRLNPEILDQLRPLAHEIPILAHGVGLSIGSYDGCSTAYLKLLQELHEALPLYWHSEHLGYTTVDGNYLNVMLPVNRNEEHLEMICSRIEDLQQSFPMPFLIENIAHLLPDYEATYSDAAFLNQLVSRTGCGIILDLYNIACDAHNYGFDQDAFLEELNLEAVREFHLAHGSVYKDQLLDIHSNRVSDAVLQQAKRVIPLCPNLEVITFELMPEAVPRVGYAGIADELKRIQDTLL